MMFSSCSSPKLASKSLVSICFYSFWSSSPPNKKRKIHKNPMIPCRVAGSRSASHPRVPSWAAAPGTRLVPRRLSTSARRSSWPRQPRTCDDLWGVGTFDWVKSRGKVGKMKDLYNQQLPAFYWAKCKIVVFIKTRETLGLKMIQASNMV